MSHPLDGKWQVKSISSPYNLLLDALYERQITVLPDTEGTKVETTAPTVYFHVTNGSGTSGLAGTVEFLGGSSYLFVMTHSADSLKMTGTIFPKSWFTTQLPPDRREGRDYDPQNPPPGDDGPGSWVADKSGGNGDDPPDENPRDP